MCRPGPGGAAAGQRTRGRRFQQPPPPARARSRVSGECQTHYVTSLQPGGQPSRTAASTALSSSVGGRTEVRERVWTSPSGLIMMPTPTRPPFAAANHLWTAASVQTVAVPRGSARNDRAGGRARGVHQPRVVGEPTIAKPGSCRRKARRQSEPVGHLSATQAAGDGSDVLASTGVSAPCSPTILSNSLAAEAGRRRQCWQALGGAVKLLRRQEHTTDGERLVLVNVCGEQRLELHQTSVPAGIQRAVDRRTDRDRCMDRLDRQLGRQRLG